MRALRWATVGLALALPGAAWANYATMGAFAYPGLWPWLVVALIIGVETPFIILIGRVPWTTGLVAAVVSNAATAFLGMGGGEGWTGTLWSLPVVLFVNIVVEAPLVLLIVWALQGGRGRLGMDWESRAVFAAVVANVASLLIVPAFLWLVPNPQPFVELGVSGHRLGALRQALKMYQADQGGLPPVVDMAGLERCLLPYAKNRDVFLFPGVARGRYFPLLEPQPWACCDFRQAAGEGPRTTPAVWEPVPWQYRRYVLFLDGQVIPLEWSQFQEIMARPAPKGSP